MKNVNDRMVINQIEWTNNDADMYLTCSVKNGFFEYNTILVLPGYELNKLILDLQKQNDEIDFQDCLKIEQWSEDECRYLFDLTDFSSVEFVFIKQNSIERLKQIRA